MKVYLSPSNQTDNRYAYGGTTEGVQCGRIGEACRAALARSGVGVMTGHMKSMQEKVQESNAYDADLHVCIHTNAFNGEVSGTRMFCFNENGNGMKACKAIFNRLAPITPGTSENIRVNADLYEIRVPAAPTAYIEVDFHDVPSVAQWIIENVNLIGETIAQGICDYFGVTYKPPVSASKEDVLYKVQVGAFAVRGNAEKMLARLKAAGFDGYIKMEKKES
nr:MAG TPA: Cell wall hydrolase autolysin [Caudoviricetes sp.]